jgi:hypothetical protein
VKTPEERITVLEDRVDIHERRLSVVEGFINLLTQLLGIAVDGMRKQLKKHYGGEDL